MTPTTWLAIKNLGDTSDFFGHVCVMNTGDDSRYRTTWTSSDVCVSLGAIHDRRHRRSFLETTRVARVGRASSGVDRVGHVKFLVRRTRASRRRRRRRRRDHRVNETMSATNALTGVASPPPPPPSSSTTLVHNARARANNDDRARTLDALLDGVPHGDARDRNDSVDDDAIRLNLRYYEDDGVVNDTRVLLFPCSSCKHKLEASAFERDRKTCRECLRRRRLRNQRKSRKTFKQRVLLLQENRNNNSRASTA